MKKIIAIEYIVLFLILVSFALISKFSYGTEVENYKSVLQNSEVSVIRNRLENLLNKKFLIFMFGLLIIPNLFNCLTCLVLKFKNVISFISLSIGILLFVLLIVTKGHYNNIRNHLFWICGFASLILFYLGFIVLVKRIKEKNSMGEVR